MGRIKTRIIKRLTQGLMKAHGSEFGEDFGKNKEIVAKYVNFNSRKLANVITGYATKLAKLAKAMAWLGLK